jgi:hypothetical protein
VGFGAGKGQGGNNNIQTAPTINLNNIEGIGNIEKLMERALNWKEEKDRAN